MDSNVECKTSPLTSKVANCKARGTFSSEKSETFNTTKQEFCMAYMDNSYGKGIYGKDDISLGKDVNIKGFEFGLAREATSDVGILGISFPGGNPAGRCFSEELKNQGVINRNAYSIFLNEANKTGSVLFGAVDHSKYLGDLKTVPIVYDETNPEIKVNVLGVDIIMNDAKVSGGISESSFLLDTGTAVSQFPKSLLAPLLGQIKDSKYDASNKTISFPDCSQIENLKFEIKFDGKTIIAPANNFMVERDADGCTFEVTFIDSDFILGIDALRSIYFVVDLDDKEVSLAQSDFSNGKQDIEVFPPPGVDRTSASTGISDHQTHLSRPQHHASTSIHRHQEPSATSEHHEPSATSEHKPSSASSIVSSIDVLLCLVISLTWLL
ncbi:uncharacterized protein SPAPADRAFT_158385 [Spathaspora passalidarum NRRL Y-27907]|uniref:Peptidase A1 domain-containing protein n=1 Tax=Spathaspora passalidarum (strain NRRL Y-27907 / 11-Y1) TaxID=619300 RepID=G3AUU3_SPAPN|nr:uncharacterized protein SPAPADRAFT_158385 [Spathaspora passalidarum NRRL Y-27907]EGW30034.1 hypothetical protein SPAPADRAFT_158385 [Spathaspora passalidarum NRRL Y-27907]